MIPVFRDVRPGTAQISEGPLSDRFQLNKAYVMSLTNQNLLRSFYMEAGLWSYSGNGGTTTASTTSMEGPEHWHWGWESVTCELRGHFMGHWLSAAARIYAQTKDAMVKAKADTIVAELAKCQAAGGGEWLAAFPESFMSRLVNGKWVWAPHYTIHKLLMGLFEMYQLAGNEQALLIMKGMASWFDKWTGNFSREQLDELLDMETGGMLETWADLYGATGEEAHRLLMLRYVRGRLFDRLLAGEDVLSNKHANTQIPEILGAARVYEVTGDELFRRIVEAFWDCAVTKRGYLCTGAGDDGELWLPPERMAARLGAGQEHCCNYNMMRLAHMLLRWTGEAAYADYWERRFVNGVLAHQHGDTGMISYFLGVGSGSRKVWGSETQHFWCCHGTLVQANSSYETQIYMRDAQGIAITQWIPSTVTFEQAGCEIGIKIAQDGQHGLYPLNKWSVTGMKAITEVDKPPIPAGRPDCFSYRVTVSTTKAGEFAIKLRLPWWISGKAAVAVNGTSQNDVPAGAGFYELKRYWSDGDTIEVQFPKALLAEPLPGAPDRVAFVDGPVVLAGLTEEERRLTGDPHKPESILTPDRERNHSWWNAGYYRTYGQSSNFRFIPLHEIKDERYTVYFPVAPI
ncbi:glycoside hydrolase family 127 protein [Paenibacillus oenotherae]|uniref:Glycoside hydrolase family 127 protein n=1 Tax=Paenibacillus oenotherae TaxID=1435645 RepID=A0ABS7D985_9BACL|nr:beta-L-arabinofuranosidase domain-containing protein [Paenibacillus oenotherae]MBW7476323.1 glycoside hydrolase family 127 protein [Paenibacillus oenotherae]